MTQEQAKNYMKGTALSSVWRARFSTDEVVELKYLLENMQDAARLLGRDPTFKVRWMGMENVPGYTAYDRKEVGMSYAFVKDEEFPLDPNMVDVLIGVLQHEMGHVRQGRVWDKKYISGRRGRGHRIGRKVYEQPASRVEQVTAPTLTKYEKRADGILKDANIDAAIIREHRLRGAYIMRGRQFYARRDRQFLDKLITKDGPLTWFELTLLWSTICIYYDPNVVDELTGTVRVLADGRSVVPRIRIFPGRSDYQEVVDVLNRLIITSVRAAQLSLTDPLDNEILKDQVRQAGKVMQEWDEAHPTAEPLVKQKGGVLVLVDSPSGESGGSQQNPRTEGGQSEESESGEAGASASASGQEEEEDGEESGEELEPDVIIDARSDQSSSSDDESTEGAGQTDSEEESEEDEAGNATDDDDDDDEDYGCSTKLRVEGGGEGSLSQMPPELAEKIFKAFEQELEDVSAKVGVPYFLMQRPQVDDSRVMSLTETKVSELDDAISVLKDVALQKTVGVKQGELNERLLWKTGTAEDTMFERKTIISDVSARIGLCIDASCSIHEHQWQIQKDIIEGFVEALGNRDDIDLVVMAYESSTCYRLYEPEFEEVRMKDVQPGGSTPTLPALKMLLERIDETCQERERTILFSVTDGQPNIGGDLHEVRDWVEEIEREREDVSVIGIGVGTSYTGVERSYERHVSVDSFEELPTKLKELLISTLLED